MGDPNSGCLGCTGCLGFVGALVFYSALGLVGLYIGGVLLAVGLLAVLGWIGWVIYQLAIEGSSSSSATVVVMPRQQTTKATRTTTNPMKGYNTMGNFAPVPTEIETIQSWEQTQPIPILPAPSPRAQVSGLQQTPVANSNDDEEFLQFTRAFPVRSLWRSRDRTSNIKIRILAVDHRWTGKQSDKVNVIITFEHISSKHRFHWPVRTFNDHWIYDTPANSRARRAGQDIPEVG